MAKLIFFCGHAGTGKSTLSRAALPLLHARTGENFCLLDKDTLYVDYSASVMKMLTGDPHDRDSPTFLEHLRPLEYAGMLATMRENLEIGVNVVLCSPFSQEIKSKQLFNTAFLQVPADTDIHVVWVTVDEALAKSRIISRNNPRDKYKLEHWEEYRVRRFEPTPTDFPELIMIDNTRGVTAVLPGLIDELTGTVSL